MNTPGLIFFLYVIVGTLAITYSSAKRTTSTKDFYTAGSELSGMQNGLAIAGDYISAASFLGVSGAIALSGFDGLYYSIGFLVSYLIVLFVVAEPIHNLGRFTLADSIAVRFQGKTIRTVVGGNMLIIAIFYMIAQLVGAGALIHFLLDVDYSLSIMLVGALMTIYVVFGGMLATSWVQIIKTVLLLAATLMLSLIVFSRFDWSFTEMLNRVNQSTPFGEKFLEPGNMLRSPIEMISFSLALILGTSGLPHIIVRFFTVKNAVAVRRSVSVAIVVIGAFYLMTIFLGFGAAALLSWDQLVSTEGGGNLAVPLLAMNLGGDFLMAFVSAIAFATILAVVSGLVLSASSAFANDVYSHVIRSGRASEREQMLAAKSASIVIGIISILLALFARDLNVAFLVSLVFAAAASSTLPLIIFTLYWKRFTSNGAVCGVVTGLLASVIIVALGPNVMNPISGLIRAEPLIPLVNPGILSIPLGFAGAVIGSLLSLNCGRYKETIYQAMTGRVYDNE